jgi:hypothetical protein
MAADLTAGSCFAGRSRGVVAAPAAGRAGLHAGVGFLQVYFRD